MEDLVILLVDDEPALLNLLSVRLGIFGSQIFTALNGEEALRILEQHSVDIIISDIHMPFMNGLELLDIVKAKDPRSPSILFATAFADNAEIESYYARGIDGVFSKPIDTKALLEAARQVTKRPEEIWSTPPAGNAPMTLQRNLPSYASAEKTRQFALGRRGFFLSLKESHPEVHTAVAFDLTFESGTISKIQGTGWVRWTRISSQKDFPSGIGVEISYLSDECRNQTISQIDSLRSVHSIPR